MSPSVPERNQLLTSLLRDVSRSFYLTLRILPAPVRSQIGLAYLLARTTDTIADTDVLPVADRLQALDRLRRRILGVEKVSLDFGSLAGQQASGAERVLLERVNEAVAVLESFDPGDEQRVREVLTVITGGQELDLRRFDGAGERNAPSECDARPKPGARASAEGRFRIVALRTEAELDDYTYRVAGCVGEFWTRMCVAHLFPAPRDPESPGASEDWFELAGVRFGKGLQLVNILRDLPRDLRHGRCYLPADSLAGVGLQPEDLLKPENEARLRPVYDGWLDRAEAHLAAGWRYTCALPGGQVRLRLACAWPVLLGVRTLVALREGRVLDPERRIKVSRGEVRGILTRTLFALPTRRGWERLFQKALVASR